jgi:uridine kinase
LLLVNTAHTVSQVLGLLETLDPTLGDGQLLCIDGRAGSGKSTVAEQIAAIEGAIVVHTDDLCPGWDGLPQVPRLLAELVEPLATGTPGSYPRYDWVQQRVTDQVVVPPSRLLVIEGVGAGARALRPWRTALLWLECPVQRRRRRALDRDGDTFASYWDDWAEAEDRYLATEADRAGADLLVRA